MSRVREESLSNEAYTNCTRNRYTIAGSGVIFFVPDATGKRPTYCMLQLHHYICQKERGFPHFHSGSVNMDTGCSNLQFEGGEIKCQISTLSAAFNLAAAIFHVTMLKKKENKGLSVLTAESAGSVR